MIEPMSDSDEIADLKKRVSLLESVVTNLALANMKLINAHNGLIRANALKTEYVSGNKNEDARKNYFDIFDTIAVDAKKIIGP